MSDDGTKSGLSRSGTGSRGVDDKTITRRVNVGAGSDVRSERGRGDDKRATRSKRTYAKDNFSNGRYRNILYENANI